MRGSFATKPSFQSMLKAIYGDRRCDVTDSNPKILQFKSQAVTSLRNIVVIAIIIVIDFDPK